MQHQSAFSIQAANKKKEKVYKIKQIVWTSINASIFSIYFTQSLYLGSALHDMAFRIIISGDQLVPTSILRILFLITLTCFT